jgi:hypothetical protein
MDCAIVHYCYIAINTRKTTKSKTRIANTLVEKMELAKTKPIKVMRLNFSFNIAKLKIFLCYCLHLYILCANKTPTPIVQFFLTTCLKSNGITYYMCRRNTHSVVSIIDLNGKTLQLSKCSNYLSQLDVSGLNSGIYLLKIEKEGWSSSSRIAVIH